MYARVVHTKCNLSIIHYIRWGLWRQKRLCQTVISNHIPQHSAYLLQTPKTCGLRFKTLKLWEISFEMGFRGYHSITGHPTCFAWFKSIEYTATPLSLVHIFYSSYKHAINQSRYAYEHATPSLNIQWILKCQIILPAVKIIFMWQ